MTLSKKQVRAKHRPENVAESLTNVDPWVPCSGLKQKKIKQPKQARVKGSQTQACSPGWVRSSRSSSPAQAVRNPTSTNKPEKQLPGSFKQITPNPTLVAMLPTCLNYHPPPQLQSDIIYRSKQLALPQVVVCQCFFFFNCI